MQVIYTKSFKTAYKKLKTKQQTACDSRLKRFMSNPFAQQLNNHPLKGSFVGYRSINITNDLRAIYRDISPDVAYFTHLGSHSELYS